MVYSIFFKSPYQWSFGGLLVKSLAVLSRYVISAQSTLFAISYSCYCQLNHVYFWFLKNAYLNSDTILQVNHLILGQDEPRALFDNLGFLEGGLGGLSIGLLALGLVLQVAKYFILTN